MKNLPFFIRRIEEFKHSFVSRLIFRFVILEMRYGLWSNLNDLSWVSIYSWIRILVELYKRNLFLYYRLWENGLLSTHVAAFNMRVLLEVYIWCWMDFKWSMRIVGKIMLIIMRIFIVILIEDVVHVVFRRIC
jgi:hypothetical protein